MDISHHQKLTTNTNNWYNLSLEDHHILNLEHHHQTHQTPTFHAPQTTQWSNYYNPNNSTNNNNPIIQNHNENPASNSSPTQLLPPPNNYQGTGLEDQTAANIQEAEEELGAMKEMMFKIASMQPVDIDPATIRRPRRRNVRISDDPQSVAARHRRERISEKIRIMQRLVPGGTKMDTASMLDEAIRYVKFLKRQIRILQSNHHPPCLGTPVDDWAKATTSAAMGAEAGSYLFGENNNNGSTTGDHDQHTMCFNGRHKFIS